MIRVGMGFDVHPFTDDPDRRLVLGGVELEGERGLVGHSDSDVIAHAVADALLGAAGIGDLGGLFPASDPTWKDADSIELLITVRDRVAAAGWSVLNVDCAVVLEAPKLAAHVRAMQDRLRGAAGADVSVKPKRAEGLGSLGRAEGIACWAVALVESTPTA
ncbi:MAG TPA: 2-C-methyl-D-erythritol 2,4-cyclodiphosphate synthase [Acidimicrobiales bacterium]|nr:2-C-methyl-D-erythritol 2,4-cyclodiphosphate synthase [Acidimicrobiales bacterium]